jgi:hypothetical protein
MFLDIIHRPVYIRKHNVSVTGFCLRLQVKLTQLVPIDRASSYGLVRRQGLLYCFMLKGRVDQYLPYGKISSTAKQHSALLFLHSLIYHHGSTQWICTILHRKREKNNKSEILHRIRIEY